MHKCENCNITIYDDIDVCPLCHQVIDELDANEVKSAIKLFGEPAPYPDVRLRQQRMKLVMRLILFISILAEAVLIVANLLTTPDVYWSAVTGAAFLFFLISLDYWVTHDSGFAAKLGIQITLSMGVLFAIDYYFTNMKGWSLEWVIPGLILFGDAMALFLMTLNRQRWYSYTMLLLYMEILSIAMMVLYFLDQIDNLIMPVLCIAISSVFMLATIIFGDRAFYREFKRRFHV
ncbi:MAG: hypothetical protein K5656_11670 [Lachnospiraceae bacterium]|nr:hypothetical protein [Lachnospiraceae bacterium]